MAPSSIAFARTRRSAVPKDLASIATVLCWNGPVNVFITTNKHTNSACVRPCLVSSTGTRWASPRRMSLHTAAWWYAAATSGAL